MIWPRVKKLQVSLKNPILVKKKENLLYLTGRSFDYRAEEYLLVKKNSIIGFGSGLEQIDWVKHSDSFKNIGKYLKGSKHLDIEFKFTYGEGAYLKHKLSGVKIKPVYSPADKLRIIKESGEIALVKKSMQIVEKVFYQVRKNLSRSAGHRPAWTEIGLADFIKQAGLKLGAEDISFPPIVASGANAAVPHHVPSNKRLRAGESIIIDFGFRYKNYCSDFTRTVFLKSVPKKLEIAYNQVEKAYNESINFCNLSVPRMSRGAGSRSAGHSGHLPSRGESSAVTRVVSKTAERPSPYEGRGRGEVVTGDDVYQRAVDVLKEKHLEKYFIHSLGHGTGLEIHELPNLSPGSKDVMRDGMVFSIEPGVYIKNLGGIRIEDLVYLKTGKVKKFINVSTNLADNII